MKDYTNSHITFLIDEHIHNKRDREIMKLHYVDGIGADTKPSEWATAELAEAVTLGITDGSRPVGYATREEAAVMVLRAIKRGVGESAKQAVAAVIERVKGAL